MREQPGKCIVKKNMALIVLAVVSSVASADNYVRGYARHDGTYVQPHYQTAPNQYRHDNYSAQGNTNPYNGREGTQRHEYSNPPTYNQNYGNPNYGQAHQRATKGLGF